MGPVAMGFAFATLGMTMVCLLAHRLTHRAGEIAGAAVFLLVGFAIGRVVSVWYDPPWSMAFYPVEDLAILSLLVFMWMRKPEWWKIALAFCFLFQLSLHATYWLANDRSLAVLYAYVLLNNLAFAAELLFLTIAGGGHVAAVVRDRRRQSGGWGLPHLGGAP